MDQRNESNCQPGKHNHRTNIWFIDSKSAGIIQKDKRTGNITVETTYSIFLFKQ